MSQYKRQISQVLFNRLQEHVKSIIVVAGPRQIGKTTTIKQILNPRDPSSCLFLALDNLVEDSEEQNYSIENVISSFYSNVSIQKDQKWIVEKWQRARKLAQEWQLKQLQQSLNTINPTGQAPNILPFVLVFDEIHLIRNWSSIVKGLWDEDRAKDLQMHVVVLGSVPLLIQRDISESLMGRYETLQMTHWSFEEMRNCFDFSLDQYIFFGGYPGTAQFALTDEKRWKNNVKDSLIEPNLVKDILVLAKIEKPALLRDLFELGCSYSGQRVAVNTLLSQLNDAGNTTTLSHYLKLLNAAGLLAGLSKYTHNVSRQRQSIPKLNVLNNAFLSVYSGYQFAEARQDKTFWGRLVESAIGAYLINSAKGEIDVSYWNENSLEVDFVLHDGKKVAALEVKFGPIKPGANKGLEAFKQKHSLLDVRTFIVGGGDLEIAQALLQPASAWLEN